MARLQRLNNWIEWWTTKTLMLMANGLLFSHSQLVRVFRWKFLRFDGFLCFRTTHRPNSKHFNVNIQIEVGKSFKRNRWAVSGIFFRNDYIIQPTNTRRFDYLVILRRRRPRLEKLKTRERARASVCRFLRNNVKSIEAFIFDNSVGILSQTIEQKTYQDHIKTVGGYFVRDTNSLTTASIIQIIILYNSLFVYYSLSLFKWMFSVALSCEVAQAQIDYDIQIKQRRVGARRRRVMWCQRK